MAVRFAFAFAFAFAVACTSGTGSEGGTGAKTFTDAQNRKCSFAGRKTTCDVPPAPKNGCTAPAVACYTVYGAESGGVESREPDAGPAAVENCPACCTENTGSSTSVADTSECASIVCSADFDCPGTESKCVSGKCARAR